jgi:hypothetical protein
MGLGLPQCVTVLSAALAGGVYFTTRKARQLGQKVWDATSRRLLWALALPLLTGGVFCLGLVYWGDIWLLAPATLVFYGLGLVQGSYHTLRDIAQLGYCQIALGLLGIAFPGYGLLLWTLGFGLLHIAYGIWMHFKYDRRTVASK